MLGYLLVFIGGSLGAGLRFLISHKANKHFGITYWSTFIINVTGSLFLGLIATLAANKTGFVSSNLKLFLCTGIAGGFTTFSTFGYENLVLLKEGQVLKSIVYVFSSLIAGLLGILCGYYLACLIN